MAGPSDDLDTGPELPADRQDGAVPEQRDRRAVPAAGLVADVTAQTDLLALNATLEAERPVVPVATGRERWDWRPRLLVHVPRCRDCRDHYLGRTPDLRRQLRQLDALARGDRA